MKTKKAYIAPVTSLMPIETESFIAGWDSTPEQLGKEQGAIEDMPEEKASGESVFGQGVFEEGPVRPQSIWDD